MRYEHQYIVEAAFFGPDDFLVRLAAEFGHMLLHGSDVGRRAARPYGVVLGVEHVKVGLYRHLGVDDDAAPLGVVDDDVGSEPTAFGVGDALLHLVLVAAAESRTLEDVVKYHLAPVALHARVALECVGEAAGLGADDLVEPYQFLDTFAQGVALARFAGVGVGYGAAEELDILLHGLEHFREAAAALTTQCLGVVCQRFFGHGGEASLGLGVDAVEVGTLVRKGFLSLGQALIEPRCAAQQIEYVDNGGGKSRRQYDYSRLHYLA